MNQTSFFHQRDSRILYATHIDLRTLQRILTYPSTDNYIRKYASIIQQNAQKLNALILELIEFRRLETGNKTLETKSCPSPHKPKTRPILLMN